MTQVIYDTSDDVEGKIRCLSSTTRTGSEKKYLHQAIKEFEGKQFLHKKKSMVIPT